MDHRIHQIISDHNKFLINTLHTTDKKYNLIFTREINKLGLTPQQAISILFIGKFEDENIYQKDLEKYMGLKNPSVTSIIKNLISQDFVYRIKDEKDGRFFHLHLTKKSHDMIDDIIRIICEVNEKTASILSSEEQETLEKLLEKWNAGLIEIIERN